MSCDLRNIYTPHTNTIRNCSYIYGVKKKLLPNLITTYPSRCYIFCFIISYSIRIIRFEPSYTYKSKTVSLKGKINFWHSHRFFNVHFIPRELSPIHTFLLELWLGKDNIKMICS